MHEAKQMTMASAIGAASHTTVIPPPCESAASQYRVGLIRFAPGRVLVSYGGVFGCSSRMTGNLQVRLCDQEMQVCTVGDRPTERKVRSLVAWIAGRREIEFPKPIDKAIFRMVSKSSGRNESERRCGLESEKPQGLSFQLEMTIACQ